MYIMFSPHGKIDEEIVRWIGKARHDIRVMAYTFSSMLICQALIGATKRQVNVSFIGDYGGMKSRGCLIDTLNQGGANCWVDRMHQIMHNKVILIDDDYLITGSYNFTNAAENVNAENCIFIDDPVMVTTYLANWELHRSHSMSYGVLRAQIIHAQTVAATMVGMDFLDIIAGDAPVDPNVMEWFQE